MKEQLYQLIEQYHLIERTWEYFWKNYDSYLEEEPEESAEHGLIDRSSVCPFIFDRSYHVLYDNEIEIIRITIHMYHAENDRHIGYYDCDFGMDGEIVDDWCVIE